MVLSKTKKTIPRKELFASPSESTELPALEYGQYEDALDEMQILSFPYTSPFELLAKTISIKEQYSRRSG